jgi:uncharacterized small protein (DUF1192 family)
VERAPREESATTAAVVPADRVTELSAEIAELRAEVARLRELVTALADRANPTPR